ncbi:hypothetical protein P7C70_g2283, partial [Phenoliferia sp. Uapishka_3]
MPFEGLARSVSLEHEAAAIERQRSRASQTSAARLPAVLADDNKARQSTALSEDDTETLAQDPEQQDLEAGPEGQKEKGEAEGAAAAPQKTDNLDEFLVTLKGREHLSPHLWTVFYRWFLTGFAGLLVLNATFASSAPSNLIPAIITKFHVSEEIFILPETYVPYILYQEAKRLRKETGDDRWHAAMESGRETIPDVLRRTVGKPFLMIVQEPMLAVITVYMSFVYGLVYLLFEAVPIIFQEQHGLNAGEAGLVFLALLSGGVLAVLYYIFGFNKQYEKLHHELAPRSVPPEVRLKPLLFAAPALAVAFFWVGWTSYSSISIASPILAICLLGSSVLFIFLGQAFSLGFQFCSTSTNSAISLGASTISLIGKDYKNPFLMLANRPEPYSYLQNAASALAINTVIRSSFGAGFPLFAGQSNLLPLRSVLFPADLERLFTVYRKLGTPGASSLLGGLAIVFIPAPLLFMKYGKQIRAKSKNAIVREDE